VPSGAVEGNDGMSARGNLGADLKQVPVHGLRADARQHNSGADAAGGTDGTEDVDPVISLVAGCAGTATFVSPNVGQAALLADPCLILPP